MIKLLLIIISILMFITQCFAAAAQTSTSGLSFEIIHEKYVFDSSNIYRAEIIEKDGTFKGLHIKLKSDAELAFTPLTKLNEKKTVHLVLGNKILTSFVIQGPLTGDLLITGISKEDAESFLKQLNATPRDS